MHALCASSYCSAALYCSQLKETVPPRQEVAAMPPRERSRNLWRPALCAKTGQTWQEGAMATLAARPKQLDRRQHWGPRGARQSGGARGDRSGLQPGEPASCSGEPRVHSDRSIIVSSSIYTHAVIRVPRAKKQGSAKHPGRQTHPKQENQLSVYVVIRFG